MGGYTRRGGIVMVMTTADERRDDALSHIYKAIEGLSDIIVRRVWGSDDFSKDYHSKLRSALNDLLDIRERLEN